MVTNGNIFVAFCRPVLLFFIFLSVHVCKILTLKSKTEQNENGNTMVTKTLPCRMLSKNYVKSHFTLTYALKK